MTFDEWWAMVESKTMWAKIEIKVIPDLLTLCQEAWDHGAEEQLIATWKQQADAREKQS